MQKYDAKPRAVLKKIPKWCFWALKCGIGILKNVGGVFGVND